MIGTVRAGNLTVRGVSLGGVYTALHVPELDLGFDVGMPLRSMAGVSTLCLSHGHVDHVGALSALLGIRALQGQRTPLRIVMPRPIVEDVTRALQAMTALQHWPLDIEAIGVDAGDEVPLKGNRVLRAFPTFHPVPSLGYLVVRRDQRLREAYRDLAGPDIAARRKAGDDLFDTVATIELAYATDTLISALDHAPEAYGAQVLILEATFLDAKKGRDAARAGCHVHLDEIIERAERFTCAHLVLMHISQLYQPRDVPRILAARLPPALAARTQVLLPPDGADWPG